jgi:ABC-2 type transport system ATP-binding protein
MTELPIRVDRVCKRFDRTVALHDVSLEIHSGEVFGLLGPNGAGKTTLIRTILDIIKPDSGRVEIFGRSFRAEDRDRFGYLPEERGLYPREETAAVLEYLGCLKGMSRDTARTETATWLARFDLGDAASKRVEQLSKGNQQKLQIAATLLARPSVAILDEPLSGLDPMSARTVNAVIRDYAAAGHTVVLSTHQMELVEALCTRVLLIAHGRAVLYGNLRDIKREHSSHTVRVLSSARYDGCPLVIGVDGPSSDGQPVNVHLREDATSDQFLAWLVAHQASVERFEQLSTPLEDIFVGVVERAAGTA